MSQKIGTKNINEIFLFFRMLHGDSKSQNSDYGSFCNTPNETFGPGGSGGGGGPSSGPGGTFHQSSVGDHHRGHQRNDSEIQIGNVSSHFPGLRFAKLDLYESELVPRLNPFPNPDMRLL